MEYIPDLPMVEREMVRKGGLAQFIKLAWPTVEPIDPLIWNWHHDAMCEHVEAVLHGEIRNLLINVPPGMTKSMIVSVMTPAYAWTERPGYRIIAIAYRDSLARRDSRRCRDLILSQWYQQRWPLKLKKEGEERLENVKTGFRIIGSVRAGVTGERGNLLVVDDPLSVLGGESPAERRRASEFFWETLPSRLTNYEEDGKIVIMQRLHGADTSGEIIERGGDEWDRLILPNEYEPRHPFVQVTSLGFEDPRTEDGELLHPERLSRRATDLLNSDQGLTERVYAGQYQQRPSPREGSIIKEDWLSVRFNIRGENPTMVIQSWDCGSKPQEKNDPSACLTAAVFKDRVEAWDYSLKKEAFPALRRRAEDIYEQFRPNFVLIEDKDAGQQLIQVLQAETKIPVIACNPGLLDKETRLDVESGFIEAKKFHLPAQAPWVAPFVAELTIFPGAPHDESADVTSQLLKWLRIKQGYAKPVLPSGIGKPTGRIQ